MTVVVMPIGPGGHGDDASLQRCCVCWSLFLGDKVRLVRAVLGLAPLQAGTMMLHGGLIIG
jgi:hypothetical protein